ncbi:biorientation of chromosomes in cell division protein 1-like 1 isoform X2 [Macrosteles quadrilineatus]|uniref:biorientation of chromosomes in cell division protein 1-like 1 isoform X2 n=1 Tax=Macrosteles quadrilineatus TaxID=74068 RepID=UPI0023E2E6ED|nr:biorientation of chromosomes in cell division protein 1-like 1 isoform X2 [Macrosteles quadrilineatus]
MANIQTPIDKFERPDPVLTNKIVTHIKSQGIFDEFRRECMADVDTKPAYHNLRQRVEGSVAAFLRMNPWRPDMNKNQLRDNLRKHIQSGGFLDIGVDRIVDQVVNPKIYTVFLPKVEEIVQSCLGMENDKPKFEPPPTQVNPEPSKFQDKHNLASRSKLPAPLMGPILKPSKPVDQEERKPSPVKEKPRDTDTDETGDKKFVVDEDELEDKEEEDEDDEESPPFEPHSEGDPLILGMRSDTSENSNDSQLVTTIVDDNLEERIDNDESAIKEESDKKDEDSSSDEYVPKTPTINTEESDGTVFEFNSITEYKQYQTKFGEESVGNVEEVVESQSMTDNHELVKDSEQDNSLNGLQKRKFNNDSYDDASSSNSEGESTGDEIKPAVFESFMKKRFKLEDYSNENETSELSNNEPENDDSYTEKSLDMPDSMFEALESNKHENSSTSPKDSEIYHHIQNEESSDLQSKDKGAESEQNEKTRYFHSEDKKNTDKRSEKDVNLREHHKVTDKKRGESSSKHSEKEKAKDQEKKRNKSTERTKRDKEDRKNRKESRHEQKENHSDSRGRSDHSKDKHKHSHSSSRHSHRSSSEHHRSDKEHKHKESRDKHRSRDKKSDKDSKDESKKKHRKHCKNTIEKDENRRSSDRDSSGPSGSTNKSNSYKSRSAMTHKESKGDFGERTTSNSDNTVSDNIEEIKGSKFDISKNSPIASPKSCMVESFSSEYMDSDLNSSKEEKGHQQIVQPNRAFINREQEINLKPQENMLDKKNADDTLSLEYQEEISEKLKSSLEDIDSSETNMNDVGTNEMHDSAIPSASLHDSSSEKENISFDEKEQFNNEIDGLNTKQSDVNGLKFKKPKIAQNIHEIKKIMKARRHMKRMEKKRIKLLMKNNIEDYESDDKSSNEAKSGDEYQNCNKSSDDESINESKSDESGNDGFKGFTDDFDKKKIEKYYSLTNKLERQISELGNIVDSQQINTNLVTSWIDLHPSFDEYIENTLNGKVHRKYRIYLPPICDENYNYDTEQNIYFLKHNWDLSDQKNTLVDSNLNNINSVFSADQQENVAVSCTGLPLRHNQLEVSTSCRNNTVDTTVHIPPDAEEDIASSNVNENKNTSDGIKKVDDSGIIAPPQSVFNITFNQTYDEVLKEKAQNSVLPSRREIENLQKNQRTVIKITKSKTTEQVFMKKMQLNVEDKVSRITKSETINGEIIENSPDSKCFPLISRITKGKDKSNNTTYPIKNHRTNSIVSSNSATNFKDRFPTVVSQEIINDVIGIQNVTLDQGSSSDQGSQSGEEVLEQKRRRTGNRQQRYDSSDLYKPRLQLSSRRVRGVGSSPEEAQAPQVVTITKRKRSATTDLNTPSSKCRR